MAKESGKPGKAAGRRADQALKAAVRRIESEGVPETLESHARRISGATPKRNKLN